MKLLLSRVAASLLCLAPLQVRAQGATKTAPVARTLVWRFGTTGYVGALAFSDDGRLLAASSEMPMRIAHGRRVPSQSVIWIWEVASGRKIRSFTTRGSVNGLAFTDRAGSHLWSAGGEFEDFGEVVLWNTHTGKAQAKYVSPDMEWFRCLAVAPDGSQLAVGTYTKTVLLDGRTLGFKKALRGIDQEDVESATFSDDGHILLTVGMGSVIRIWNSQSGQLLHPPFDASGSYATFYDPSGKSLLLLGDNIEIRDCAHFNLMKSVPIGRISVSFYRATSSSSRKFVAGGAGDGSANNPYSVFVWDVATGKLLEKFIGHTKDVLGLSFSRDEHLLASADQSGRINVWNIAPLHP